MHYENFNCSSYNHDNNSRYVWSTVFDRSFVHLPLFHDLLPQLEIFCPKNYMAVFYPMSSTIWYENKSLNWFVEGWNLWRSKSQKCHAWRSFAQWQSQGALAASILCLHCKHRSFAFLFHISTIPCTGISYTGVWYEIPMRTLLYGGFMIFEMSQIPEKEGAWASWFDDLEQIAEFLTHSGRHPHESNGNKLNIYTIKSVQNFVVID